MHKMIQRSTNLTGKTNPENKTNTRKDLAPETKTTGTTKGADMQNPLEAPAPPNSNPYRAPLEIIQGISEIFLHYGLRSSSMDDICNHLKISKKTLYTWFDNKDQVVEAVMQYRQDKYRAEDILRQTKDIPAIQLVMSIAENITESLKSLLPLNTFDMKKYHPLVYEKMTRQDSGHIHRCLNFLVRKGWQEGVIRKDIDTEIQEEILNMEIAYVADPENWPKLKHSIDQILFTIFENLVRSIATPEGIEELEKILARKGKEGSVFPRP